MEARRIKGRRAVGRKNRQMTARSVVFVSLALVFASTDAVDYEAMGIDPSEVEKFEERMSHLHDLDLGLFGKAGKPPHQFAIEDWLMMRKGKFDKIERDRLKEDPTMQAEYVEFHKEQKLIHEKRMIAHYPSEVYAPRSPRETAAEDRRRASTSRSPSRHAYSPACSRTCLSQLQDDCPSLAGSVVRAGDCAAHHLRLRDGRVHVHQTQEEAVLRRCKSMRKSLALPQRPGAQGWQGRLGCRLGESAHAGSRTGTVGSCACMPDARCTWTALPRLCRARPAPRRRECSYLYLPRSSKRLVRNSEITHSSREGP